MTFARSWLFGEYHALGGEGRLTWRIRIDDPLSFSFSPHSAQEEDVTLKPEALDVLTRIGAETSLRYSINLITTANLAARRRRADAVEIADVRRVYSLFIDEKRSVQYLAEHAEQFMQDDFPLADADGLAANAPVVGLDSAAAAGVVPPPTNGQAMDVGA